MGLPGEPYIPRYALRSMELGANTSATSSSIAKGTRMVERVLKVPPWLFSAESDDYPCPAAKAPAVGSRVWSAGGKEKRHGLRVTARHWHTKPSPTALVHFVCSRWPGSDGRKIAMRLYGRWLLEDVAWVGEAADAAYAAASKQHATPEAMQTAAAAAVAALPTTTPPKPPRRIVGFAAPLPLEKVDRWQASTQSWVRRTRQTKGKVIEPQSLQAWHALTATLALASKRAAVMPLFECARMLSTTSRWAWVLEAPGTSDGDAAAGLDRPTGKEGARPKACILRYGTGCFTKLAYPEEAAAAIAAGDTHTVTLDAITPAAIRTLLAALSANATVAAPRALFIDVAAAASRTTTEDLIATMREIFEDETVGAKLGHILSQGARRGKGRGGPRTPPPGKETAETRAAELQRARADLDAGLLNTPDRARGGRGLRGGGKGRGKGRGLSGEARGLSGVTWHGRRLLAGKAKGGGGGKGRGGKGRGKSAFAAGVAKKDGGRPFGRRFDQRWRHQLAAATCGDTFIHWPSRPPYVC